MDAADTRGAPLSLTYGGLFRRRSGGDESRVRAGPGDHFGEVRVAPPRAEFGEVHLQEAGALVLLCGVGEESRKGSAAPRRAAPAGCSPRPPPEGSRYQRTPTRPRASTR